MLPTRVMRSLLSVHGVYVQESRVRDAMRRIDPVGVSFRWSQSIRRRVYQVNCPNALWHIDGNHSLIRWKLNLLFMVPSMAIVDIILSSVFWK